MPRPSRRLPALLAALLALAVAGATAAPDRDARFRVPREELLARLKTIGVVPAAVPQEVPDADGVAARLDSEVTASLRDAGFEVVPPLAMREITARALSAIGGVYDPLTGRPIQERVDAVREFTRGEYALAHQVDALLEVEVVAGHARFSDGYASWDGVRDNITSHGGAAGFFAGIGAAGVVRSLSLAVRLVDAGGNVLYANVAGLQALSFLHRSLSLQSYREISVEPQFIMHDPLRDERALALVLGPLRRDDRSPAAGGRRAEPVPIPEVAAVARAAGPGLPARYPRLALAPLDPAGIERGAEVAGRYRDALGRRLTQLGFIVVDTPDYAELWAQERERVGGFHDPNTGRLDRAKVKASRARVFAALAARYTVAAVVLPELERRPAPFWAGIATWDGATETVDGKSLVATITGASGQSYGELEAVSLAVRMLDPEGELLFEGRAGIQLTKKLTNRAAVAVAAPDLFANLSSDQRVVDAALQNVVISAEAKN